MKPLDRDFARIRKNKKTTNETKSLKYVKAWIGRSSHLIIKIVPIGLPGTV